jgi:hypothetical protein
MLISDALNTLNKSVSKPKRTGGPFRQSSSSQSSSNTTHSKTKRTVNRKQN